jgi:hypothetical protein
MTEVRLNSLNRSVALRQGRAAVVVAAAAVISPSTRNRNPKMTEAYANEVKLFGKWYTASLV